MSIILILITFLELGAAMVRLGNKDSLWYRSLSFEFSARGSV